MSEHPTDFFSELKRRKVYRVSAAYLAVAFAALEGADLVFPVLGFGPGVFNALVILSLLGFPVAVGLAWTFDVTESGIQRTGPPTGGGPTISAPDRWVRLKAALLGAGFVAVVWMGARAWQPVTETETGNNGVPVEKPTLAVLPLTDLSPDADQAYLADGLHEEILHRLAQLPGTRLTSRTSSMFMRGVAGEVAGDSLGVRYVLEGSIRMAGDSILLTVQLIDALTDEHLWSEVMGGRFELAELFGLQRALAMKVAASLHGTLAAESDFEGYGPPTRSLEAYNEFLRGVYLTNQFDVDSWWQAVDHFERALQLDPEFGRAHARMASILAYLNNYGGVTQGELFGRMRSHGEAAMRYAPNEPRSQLAQMAWVWPQEFAWEEARSIIERALELDPNHVDALWYLAEWYGVIAGNTDRGLELMAEAFRLDPFSPSLHIVRGWVLFNGRRFNEAAEDYAAVVAVDPSNGAAALSLISSLALAGRREEAGERFDAMASTLPRPWRPTMAAHAARVGEVELAREILEAAIDRKESGGSVPASGIAVGYAVLGEVDLALDWLERGFEEEGGIYYLRSPDWDNLAAEPRFQALWDRVGLYGEHPALASAREASAGA